MNSKHTKIFSDNLSRIIQIALLVVLYLVVLVLLATCGATIPPEQAPAEEVAPAKEEAPAEEAVVETGKSVVEEKEAEQTDDSFPGEYPPVPGFVPKGTTSEELAQFSQETRCGSDWNTEDVEQYEGTLGVTEDFVDAHERPVGVINWNANLGNNYLQPGNVSGIRWCSGSLIDDNLFLTAGHCFDDQDVYAADGTLIWQLPRVDNTNDIIPPSEIAQNMNVGFNHQEDPHGNLRNEQRFAITHLEEHRLGNLDYAIVRLERSPGGTFGIQPISRNDAELNDMVCIIGHPLGWPKQIEAGPANDFTRTKIRYNDADTEGGNSGSGILHPGYEAIVGVHTNGGCDNTSPGAGGGFNSGVRISVIIDASPIIRRILAPSPTPTRCPPGSGTSGCPSGWYCSEPGMCGCLQCDRRGSGR